MLQICFNYPLNGGCGGRSIPHFGIAVAGENKFDMATVLLPQLVKEIGGYVLGYGVAPLGAKHQGCTQCDPYDASAPAVLPRGMTLEEFYITTKLS